MCMECLNGAQTAVQTAALVGGPVVASGWNHIKRVLRIDFRSYNEQHGLGPDGRPLEPAPVREPAACAVD